MPTNENGSYIMLRHDFKGLGRRGDLVTKEDFDAFVRSQNKLVEGWLTREALAEKVAIADANQRNA